MNSRRSPGGRTKGAQESGDEKDEKYSKFKESKNMLYRRLFTFIAISFMMTSYICFDSSMKNHSKANIRSKFKYALNGVKEGMRKNRVNSIHMKGFNTKKRSVNVLTLEPERVELDRQVREIKATGVIMETDEKSLKLTKALQMVTRKVLKEKYGDHPNYRVKVDLEFQESIPDFEKNGRYGTLIIEMAPVQYLPVSVYNWLEIARTWKSGAFHRNADHVLQATTHAGAVGKSLAFQEYSEKYPHKKGTVGYCGRPSGPCWYISILDNTKNHGPGSQQEKNPHEADANFGKIVVGWDDVVPRIHSVPQKSWLDKKNQVFIKTMTILVPTGPGGAFIEWKP